MVELLVYFTFPGGARIEFAMVNLFLTRKGGLCSKHKMAIEHRSLNQHQILPQRHLHMTLLV